MIFTLLQDKVRLSRSSGNGRRPQHPGDPSVDLTLEILEKITAGVRIQSLNYRLWNGVYWPNEIPKPATLVLNRPSALREMLGGGSEIAVAEAYIREAFDVEGEMVAAFEFADILDAQTGAWTRSLSIARMLRCLPDFMRATGAKRCPPSA